MGQWLNQPVCPRCNGTGDVWAYQTVHVVTGESGPHVPFLPVITWPPDATGGREAFVVPADRVAHYRYYPEVYAADVPHIVTD